MKNESLYRKTVDILYDAYFNGTLQHNNCYACACGNIIAANMGYKVVLYDAPAKYSSQISLWIDERKNTWEPQWDEVFCTQKTEGFLGMFKKQYQDCDFKKYKESAAEEINSTGYTVYELALIEKHFEMVSEGRNSDEYMFNGLVAVLEVLKQIHEVENNDIELGKFKNHYQCKTQTLNTR